MGFNVEKLGSWSPEREFKVTLEHAKQYAAATNDDIPDHITGELAPPLFAVVPQNFAGAGEEKIDPAGGVIDLPPEQAMRVLHGEQDIFFHQPIQPGMVLRIKSATVGVHAKGTGTAAVLKFETTDAADAPVNTMFMTLFFRGVLPEQSAGEPAPSLQVDEEYLQQEPVLSCVQRFDLDQPVRYAEASGDFMPIHLDVEVARSVGLPGVIIHGLCTMAFASQALIKGVADGDPRKLKRLAVRFSNVALPGDTITTQVRAAGRRDGRRIFPFHTNNEQGQALLSNGIAEFTT